MEKIKILAWLHDNQKGFGSGHGYGYGSGHGYGSGSGSGYGYGDSSGYGSGYGDGSGHGYGSGSGSGYGDSSGYGISFFCGHDVFIVDNIPTIITGIHGSLAKGYILNRDFTLDLCYVVKGNGYFSHGETIEKANSSLLEKIFKNMDKDEAIEKFITIFERGEKYSCQMFYEWHHYLTGSCEMGRKSFMRNRNIKMDDTFTVDEFFALTENDFGSEVIKELKERFYNN